MRKGRKIQLAIIGGVAVVLLIPLVLFMGAVTDIEENEEKFIELAKGLEMTDEDDVRLMLDYMDELDGVFDTQRQYDDASRFEWECWEYVGNDSQSQSSLDKLNLYKNEIVLDDVDASNSVAMRLAMVVFYLAILGIATLIVFANGVGLF